MATAATTTTTKMQSFHANDHVKLAYIDTGVDNEAESGKPWLVLIHGFTGSSSVWQRNIPAFAQHYRVIVPDLRGHGSSTKCTHGFHVSRLAMDLRELLLHLDPQLEGKWKAIGGSLGCSILWAYASLFTTIPFTHTIFVDQSPLQNADPSSGWDHTFHNRGMNNPLALSSLQTTLALSPATAHKGTIAACLSYRAFPQPDDRISATSAAAAADEAFFLTEALKGDPTWLGKLMADHTALDWRASIAATFGPASGSRTSVLVVASSRSGCFPAAGPMAVVGLVNGGEVVVVEGERRRAEGVVVDWGGHWCYWEDPGRFDSLCLKWLESGEIDG